MPAERYYINSPLYLGDYVILKEQEFHHLAHVMRVRKGQSIELVNGKGCLAKATLEEITKDCAKVRIEDLKSESPSSLRVILAQAIPKPSRLDYILEKGTELGADEFWLFPSENSVKSEFTLNQQERMRMLMIAAMKQCGRLFLPEIVLKSPLGKWDPFSSTAFFGDTDEGAQNFSDAWKNVHLASPIIFCVGPESGFSSKEVEILKNKGARGVKLHRYILRTDTAPLVALSLIEHWIMKG